MILANQNFLRNQSPGADEQLHDTSANSLLANATPGGTVNVCIICKFTCGQGILHIIKGTTTQASAINAAMLWKRLMLWQGLHVKPKHD